jgi:MoaA/NifB/PqqE/SkfB family radical SAM enzyme
MKQHLKVRTLGNQIKESITLKRIPSPTKTLATFIMYNCLQRFYKRPFLPRAMCLYVTYRCNMRCKMCGIWKQARHPEGEFTLGQLEHTIADPLFSKLEYINVNGGEPSLRDDLPEIVKLLIDSLPKLKTITLNSNGLKVNKVAMDVKKISAICQKNGIRFSVSISLHQRGEAYDSIAGVKNAYPKVIETLRALKEIQRENNFYVAVNCVITNLNLVSLHDMLKWSAEEQIPINFTVGEVRDRFNNLDMAETITIGEQDQKMLVNFLRSLAANKLLFKHHSFRYKTIADMIEFHTARNISCHYAMGGFILGAEGLLYYCKKSKAIGSCTSRRSVYEIYYDKDNLKYRNETIINTLCRTCIPNTFIKQELEKDVIKFLLHLLSKN